LKIVDGQLFRLVPFDDPDGNRLMRHSRYAPHVRVTS
jgi:hypothetical protein